MMAPNRNAFKKLSMVTPIETVDVNINLMLFFCFCFCYLGMIWVVETQHRLPVCSSVIDSSVSPIARGAYHCSPLPSSKKPCWISTGRLLFFCFCYLGMIWVVETQHRLPVCSSVIDSSASLLPSLYVYCMFPTPFLFFTSDYCSCFDSPHHPHCWWH